MKRYYNIPTQLPFLRILSIGPTDTSTVWCGPISGMGRTRQWCCSTSLSPWVWWQCTQPGSRQVREMKPQTFAFVDSFRNKTSRDYPLHSQFRWESLLKESLHSYLPALCCGTSLLLVCVPLRLDAGSGPNHLHERFASCQKQGNSYHMVGRRGSQTRCIWKVYILRSPFRAG